MRVVIEPLSRFSTAIYTDVNDLINHMNVVHAFDYLKLRSEMKLSFYQQVKLFGFKKWTSDTCCIIKLIFPRTVTV